MNKRLLSGLMMLSLCATMGTACSSNEDAKKLNLSTLSKSSEKNGTVSLRVWGAEADQELLAKLVEGFKEKYKGEANFDITVECVEEGDCKGTVLGNLPETADVFCIVDDQLRALAASGIIRPIENQEAIKKASLEGAVEAASINDELYAYPMTADNGYFLYYNKKYIKDSDVATMDKLLATAQSQQKKVTMDITSGWYLYSFFANTGLTLGLQEDGINNYCTWNSKKGDIKGVDVASSIYDIAGSPAFLCGNDEVLLSGAKDGSVAAGVSGVWLGVQLKEAWGDNLGATKLPTYTVNGKQVQMGSYTGYKLACANAYSDNYDWASKLAEWLVTKDNELLRFELRGYGPANKEAAATEAVSQNMAINALLAQSEFGSLQRVGGRFWAPASNLGKTLSTHSVTKDKLQHSLDAFVKSATAQAD